MDCTEKIGALPQSLPEIKKTLLPHIDFLRGDFTLSSGKKSDFYINGKTTTLKPQALCLAAQAFLLNMAPMNISRVGGLTLGADALVGAITALSYLHGAPKTGFIVRKEAKGHGTSQAIEGPALAPGERIIVIEDVVTTGGSALQAVEKIRLACPQADIVSVFALVDREDGGEAALAAAGLSLWSLFTKTELFASGR